MHVVEIIAFYCRPLHGWHRFQWRFPGTWADCQLASLPLPHIMLFSLHWDHKIHNVILYFVGREEERHSLWDHDTHLTKMTDTAGLVLLLRLVMMMAGLLGLVSVVVGAVCAGSSLGFSKATPSFRRPNCPGHTPLQCLLMDSSVSLLTDLIDLYPFSFNILTVSSSNSLFQFSNLKLSVMNIYVEWECANITEWVSV